MKTAVKTPATDTPVTLQEAKDHLRITHAAQDDYINGLILAATQATEKHINQVLAETVLYAYTERFFPVLILPKGPLMEILAVDYYGTDNQLHTLTPDFYTADHVSPRPVIFLDEYPPTASRWDAVRIEYKAGYAQGAAPAAIKAAILLQIGYLYENPTDAPHRLVTASDHILRHFRSS